MKGVEMDLWPAAKQLETAGYAVLENYLKPKECEYLLDLIQRYRESHSISTIRRAHGERALDYSVIQGEEIRDSFPDVLRLYENVNQLVSQLSGLNLVPLSDEKVFCNINITGKGGSYRWHYDRNAVTAILYLNEVRGGETECYPNYRIILPGVRYTKLQQWIDSVFQKVAVRLSKPVIVAPRAGRLLIMRGDRCLHSVSPMQDARDRVAIIMSYDVPGAAYSSAKGLNAYLYTDAAGSSTDPNYR